VTAPRITLEEVNAAIQNEAYHRLPESNITICVLTLANGFTVTGESACVSTANFNQEIGNKFAREKAIDDVWKLMGFALAERLYQNSKFGVMTGDC
jgi:hypothetical protein